MLWMIKICRIPQVVKTDCTQVLDPGTKEAVEFNFDSKVFPHVPHTVITCLLSHVSVAKA